MIFERFPVASALAHEQQNMQRLLYAGFRRALCRMPLRPLIANVVHNDNTYTHMDIRRWQTFATFKTDDPDELLAFDPHLVLTLYADKKADAGYITTLQWAPFALSRWHVGSKDNGMPYKPELLRPTKFSVSYGYPDEEVSLQIRSAVIGSPDDHHSTAEIAAKTIIAAGALVENIKNLGARALHDLFQSHSQLSTS